MAVTNQTARLVRQVQIAEAACKVILRVGLENTKLKDVAADLGYTTGVIQHYFEDKEHLLLFAKNHLFDQVFLRMQAAADRVHDIQRLLAMVLELLPTNPDNVRLFQLLVAFRGRAIGRPDLSALQRERDKIGWTLYMKEIRELQRQGLVSAQLDPWRCAVALNAFVEGLALPVAMGEQRINPSSLIEDVTWFVNAMFGSSSSRSDRANTELRPGRPKASPGARRTESQSTRKRTGGRSRKK